jgi:ELKS/RAB6-interacting/CAST family protein 1
LDRQQRDCDLQESKQQLDIRDRKINVLNRKIENLEEQIRDKSTQITLARAKLSAATTTAATINIQQQTSATNNTLVSNLETTIGEKERLIEKLREQKHTLDIEHQEEIEQLQKTLNETRLKLEQKEKDYYEGQVMFISLSVFYSNLGGSGTPSEIIFTLKTVRDFKRFSSASESVLLEK